MAPSKYFRTMPNGQHTLTGTTYTQRTRSYTPYRMHDINPWALFPPEIAEELEAKERQQRQRTSAARLRQRRAGVRIHQLPSGCLLYVLPTTMPIAA